MPPTGLGCQWINYVWFSWRHEWIRSATKPITFLPNSFNMNIEAVLPWAAEPFALISLKPQQFEVLFCQKQSWMNSMLIWGHTGRTTLQDLICLPLLFCSEAEGRMTHDGAVIVLDRQVCESKGFSAGQFLRWLPGRFCYCHFGQCHLPARSAGIALQITVSMRY